MTKLKFESGEHLALLSLVPFLIPFPIFRNFLPFKGDLYLV